MFMYSTCHSLNLELLLSDIYYIAFPKDRTYRKALVVFTFTIEVAQTLMATHDGFRALASGWGVQDALNHVYWSCVDTPIMGSIRMSHEYFK